MPRRVHPALPPLVPLEFTLEECISQLESGVGWTRAQAVVVYAGIGGATYREIALHLGISANTVHVHYGAAFVWIGADKREVATAIAIAVLWRCALRRVQLDQ